MPSTDEHGIAWYTRREVADLREVDPDTVKRHERRGRYPNSRPRRGDPQQTVEIPESDLRAAGDVPADATAAEVGGRLQASQAEQERDALRRELAEVRPELARLQERDSLLSARLEAAGEEIAWLRTLVERQSVGRTA
jgi:hypothetical protein